MHASISIFVAALAGLGLAAPTAQPEKRWNYGDMMAQAVADDVAVYGKANSDAWMKTHGGDWWNNHGKYQKWNPMPEYTKWSPTTNPNPDRYWNKYWNNN
ncbi:hypothetical protein DCS_00010 [Drechmeria coniospora]|uniref:Uncharacterized protein n=1 Tax=Drechmeria coniospora TaxID=98403 RepID=A0A151GP61_DRECN|nr:hypothetical protein DCS_00010 [Drechmeria coniospora]KYK58883.1 hypothetical protein DCS_00010 [Drechmeria coniospora]